MIGSFASDYLSRWYKYLGQVVRCINYFQPERGNRMKQISLLSVILILIASNSAFAQQPAAPAPVVFEQVAPNLYMITGGRGANGGVYIGEKEALLIDSKQDSASVAQVLAMVKKFTTKPVTRLVNTHADGDHVFGNRFLPEGITIIAHENCLKEFFLPSMRGQSSDWDNPVLKPFLPTVTFTDRMDLTVAAKRVELWHFGVGHTTGDTVVYFPEEKVAFVGDQIFIGRVTLIHAYKGGSAFGNVANLEKMLAALPAEKFVSGHSPIQDRIGVQNHIEKLKAMQKRVRDLKAKGQSIEQIQKQFEQSEETLVWVIYNEIK